MLHFVYVIQPEANPPYQCTHENNHVLSDPRAPRANNRLLVPYWASFPVLPVVCTTKK